MAAIDTNVLIRILVKDDDIQSRKALRFIQKHGEVFVSNIIVCETSWVLESCYKVKNPELISVIENILKIEQLKIEDSDSAWLALEEFKEANADFSDYLISAIAQKHGHSLIGTFDKKASKINNFKLIE